MSEQGTEKTNPLHGLERDGTGTGVWTHPAAETMLPKQPERCECGECYVGAGVWWWQGENFNGPARACIATERNAGHCPGKCGCRLSVVDGEPRVGPSQNRLLAALAEELGGHEDCPGDYANWPCPGTHDCETGPAALCWLLYYGLATTYADAQAMWARTKEAAK